jgi:hypothetical protein
MNAKLLSCQPIRALKLKLIGVVAVRMTLTLVSLAVVTLIVSDVLHAQTPPWCAIMGGTTQCNYFTEQQCLQTLSGIGGQCILNPAGSGPQAAPTAPSSENAQGLLPLQLQDPGPPPGLDGNGVPPPPNN